MHICYHGKKKDWDGFTKKTQKTPTKEIIKAKQIKEEFEEEYYATKDFR